MRRLLWFVLAALACAPFVVAGRSAAAAPDCGPAAVEQLRTGSPQGFAVYRAVKDKSFFLGWVSCDEAERGLPTAVHESVHYITSEIDAFPLVGGGQVPRPHEASRFFAPSRIA